MVIKIEGWALSNKKYSSESLDLTIRHETRLVFIVKNYCEKNWKKILMLST